jgi:hypothetical protein
MNLERLHEYPKELSKLRKELLEFITPEVQTFASKDVHIVAFPTSGTMPDDYTVMDFAELQQWCWVFLEGVEPALPRREYVKIVAGYLLVRSPDMAKFTTMLTGATKDLFLLMLHQSLLLEPASRIRRCPEPKCRRFFYRVKKQKFCSRNCAVRASMRNLLRRKAESRRAKEGAKKRRRTSR